MAPSRANASTAPFAKDERVLCFHHEMLYEAKILDVRPSDDSHSWQYKIHYKGWKKTVGPQVAVSWDDWVPQDRVRKFTADNKELAAQLQNQMKTLKNSQQKPPPSKLGKRTFASRGTANDNDPSSARGSEERHTSVAAASGVQSARGPRRNRDYDLESEDTFLNRPSIKIGVPDHIKALLVDDWENITKNQQLVPLPAAKPITLILNDYLGHEKKSRIPNSAESDILEEVIKGVREYFDKCLGRILLYRFERNQYVEVREGWLSKTGELAGKTPCDTYGAEHLCRLLVSFPELIAQTNMDQQSVNRLRDELTKLTNWIAKHATKYFVNEYETPSQEYCEKARGVS